MTDNEMSNKNLYAKAYCHLMGGGTQGVGEDYGMGHDKEIETMCRKTMYNYCLTPVKVTNSEGKEIMYPLNIFNDECKDWCSLYSNKLSEDKEILPNQKGVCDMAIGKVCQQLQVDGWINPENWNNSKLLDFNLNGINAKELKKFVVVFIRFILW